MFLTPCLWSARVDILTITSNISDMHLQYSFPLHHTFEYKMSGGLKIRIKAIGVQTLHIVRLLIWCNQTQRSRVLLLVEYQLPRVTHA